MMIKIFLVEDEIAIRKGIKNSIDWEKEGYEFVGEAGDGELAYPMILKTKPDILITDIKMPFMDGLQLSKLVRKELPATKILILSGYDEFEYAKEAIKLQVAEYLLKPISSAKLLDVQVNEFAICMGPVLWQKKKGETTYSLRAIPIGGFCAMEGEDEESDNPRAFPQKSWWRRLVILAAGSFMNYLAGFLAIVILYTGASSYSAPIITDFFEGCPLEASDGLQVGDELYKIDGRRVYLYSDVGTLLSRNKTGVYDVVVKRNGELVELPDFSMKPQLYDVDGVQEYKYGLYFGSVPGGFGTCLKYSWYTSLDFARMVWMSLQDLLSGLVSVSDMSGPVGIVSTISEVGSQAQTVRDGLESVAYLGAFIAINLAVMNMLPLPALDGGRIFLLLVNTLFTAVTKKKIPAKYEAYIHAAGMVLLLSFMAFVTFKDIWKLFT